MKIRPIKRRDLHACAAILAADPQTEFADTESALSALSGYFDTENFHGVLAETGAVIGFALGNVSHRHFGSIFYLSEFCTHIDNRMRGVGAAVYRALEAELQADSVGTIYVPADRMAHCGDFFLKRDFRRAEPADYYAKTLSI